MLKGQRVFPPIHIGMFRDEVIYLLSEFGGVEIESTFWTKVPSPSAPTLGRRWLAAGQGWRARFSALRQTPE
jgi:hypothetical protein